MRDTAVIWRRSKSQQLLPAIAIVSTTLNRNNQPRPNAVARSSLSRALKRRLARRAGRSPMYLGLIEVVAKDLGDL